jgi:phosphomannomutase
MVIVTKDDKHSTVEETATPKVHVNIMDAQCLRGLMAAKDADKARDWADRQQPSRLVLFDVDGTLTPARKAITPEMLQALRRLREKCVIAFVGGSDLAKQQEQLGPDGALHLFDFGFSENGAVAHRRGQKIGESSLLAYLGEGRYQRLVNWTLSYLSAIDLPCKRGNFVELRRAMVNVSPIGRSCSYDERLQFVAFDAEHRVREQMVQAYGREFSQAGPDDFGLSFAIGGQISIDIFPRGWDKTFCLGHLRGEGFQEVHFFGDKTQPGGNDHEIHVHPAVIGHSVTSPDDTIRQLQQLFGI